MSFFGDVYNSIVDRFSSDIVRKLVDSNDPDARAGVVMREYARGNQRALLRVKADQFNDNMILNFTKLVLNRIVSQMVGHGFDLDFEGDNKTPTEQEQYVKATLEANKQEIFFQRAAKSAGEAGTGYIYLIPNGIEYRGKWYTRLQLVDPLFVKMEVAPEDFDMVIRYIVSYNFTDERGKERTRKRIIQHNGEAAWVIEDWLTNDSGKLERVSSVDWLYPFAPMVHWQNQPRNDAPTGEPDLGEAEINGQDRINFTMSNISKIVRLFANPQRYSKGGRGSAKVEVGPDQMPDYPNDATSGIYQLEQLGDLAGAVGFYGSLRKAFFDVARVVDIDNIGDKLGALTNFALHVLYQDNNDMISTKRELFGDMVEDLADHLQVINGMEVVPCKSVWPDWLPVNEAEELQAAEAKQRMGIVSKETLSVEFGYDWEQESTRIEADQQAEQARMETVGSDALKRFMGGG